MDVAETVFEGMLRKDEERAKSPQWAAEPSRPTNNAFGKVLSGGKAPLAEGSAAPTVGTTEAPTKGDTNSSEQQKIKKKKASTKDRGENKFEDLKVAELKALCKEKGIAGYSKWKKAELVQALTREESK